MDIPEPVKKYWPYALGGVVGIYLLMRMGGGGGSSTGDILANQAAAGLANAQQALAAKAQQDAANLEQSKVNAAAFTSFMAAQGELAKGVGASAKDVITALQAPTVQAINAGAAENVITIQSATAAAIAGMNAQTAQLQSVANANNAVAATAVSSQQALAQAIAASSASIGAQQQALRPGATVPANNEGWKTLATLGTAAIAACDERLKENIAETDADSLAAIVAIEFKQFDYRDGVPTITPHVNVGPIAQQLREIDATFVHEGEDGILRVNAITTLFAAMHAIQQLAARVDQLEKERNEAHA